MNWIEKPNGALIEEEEEVEEEPSVRWERGRTKMQREKERDGH